MDNIGVKIKRIYFKFLWVLIIILSPLLVSEIGLRKTEARLSGDINHIKDIPNIARDILNSNKKSILFLGNSLINEAINSDVILRNIESNIQSIYTIDKITPDGTSLYDWHFLYKKYFNSDNISPNTVFVGFAWDELSDQTHHSMVRLGAYYCEIDDLILLHDIQPLNSERIADFLLAYTTRIWRHKERIRRKILDGIIPYYRRYEQRIHTINPTSETNQSMTQYTYKLLDTFVYSNFDSSTRVYFISMPTINSYKLDESLSEKINLYSNASLVDLRNLNNINSQDYKDPIHFNSGGKKKFSNIISRFILNEIKNKNIK